MFGQMKLVDGELGEVQLVVGFTVIRRGSLRQCTATALRYDEVSQTLREDFLEQRVIREWSDDWDRLEYRR